MREGCELLGGRRMLGRGRRARGLRLLRGVGGGSVVVAAVVGDGIENGRCRRKRRRRREGVWGACMKLGGCRSCWCWC